MDALRLALADKELEIVQLKKRLHEEESENQQLREQLNDVLSERSEAPTTVTIFAAPPDHRLMQRIEETRKLIDSLQDVLAQDSQKRIAALQEQIQILEKKTENGPNIPTTPPPAFDPTTCFNAMTTKIIHLAKAPPMSPQQFYSSNKSSDKAISELQQQLNNSRKEIRRTAEVATRKCKEFRSLCCKLFGWRVDVLDSEKRNTKRCRVHSIFDEEDYLQIEFKRKDCHLIPSPFLDQLDSASVHELITTGGIPRLLQQLYQHLHAQHLKSEN